MTVAFPDRLKEIRQRFLAGLKESEFAQGLTALGTGAAVSFLVQIGDSPLKNWRLSGIEALPSVANLSIVI